MSQRLAFSPAKFLVSSAQQCVTLISGKLRKHACLKKITDSREFNQNICRLLLKDKMKIFKSFFSNLIKMRVFVGPNLNVNVT